MRVKLRAPLPVEGGDEGDSAVVGYFRTVGVRCHPDNLKQWIASVAEEDPVDWDDTTWKEVGDIRELDPEVRSRVRLTDGEGVWWTSGRVFFPPDE
jgi:hypothetical protein